MTLTDLMNTKEADLPRVLGEVLQPDECYYCGYYMRISGQCKRSQTYTKKDYGCKRIWKLPIPLDDYNLAMKYRDKYVAEFGGDAYGRSLLSVYRRSKHYDCISYDTWLAIKLQPRDILLACAGLELGRKDNGS